MAAEITPTVLSHFVQSLWKVVFPVFAIGIGATSGLGIWLPRFRAHWKGTQITCGRLSCAGGALSFVGVGVAFLAVDSVPEPHRIWSSLPVVMGLVLCAVGYALDASAHSSRYS